MCGKQLSSRTGHTGLLPLSPGVCGSLSLKTAPSAQVPHQLSVTHHLDQGLPDSPGPQAKFSLPPPFVNKVLLEYSFHLLLPPFMNKVLLEYSLHLLPPPFVNKVLLEYSLHLRVNLRLLLC